MGGLLTPVHRQIVLIYDVADASGREVADLTRGSGSLTRQHRQPVKQTRSSGARSQPGFLTYRGDDSWVPRLALGTATFSVGGQKTPDWVGRTRVLTLLIRSVVASQHCWQRQQFFSTQKWKGYPDGAVLEAWVDASPLHSLGLPVEHQQQAHSLRLSVV